MLPPRLCNMSSDTRLLGLYRKRQLRSPHPPPPRASFFPPRPRQRMHLQKYGRATPASAPTPTPKTATLPSDYTSQKVEVGLSVVRAALGCAVLGRHASRTESRLLFERWDDLAMQSQEKDWRRAEQDNRQSRLAEMSDECSSRSSSKGSEEEVRVKANGGISGALSTNSAAVRGCGVAACMHKQERKRGRQSRMTNLARSTQCVHARGSDSAIPW